MKKYHNLIVPAEQVRRHTLEERRAIAERVEARLGLQYFITPEGLRTYIPAPIAAARVVYCGPDGKVCVWEDNGFEICGPCAKLRGAEVKQNDTIADNGADQIDWK